MIAVVIVAVVAAVLVQLVWGNLVDKIGFLCWSVLVVFLVVGAVSMLVTGTIPTVVVQVGVGSMVGVVVTEAIMRAPARGGGRR